MTKFFKRIVTTSFALTAAFSLVACGNDNPESESTSQATTSISTEMSTTASTESSTEFKLTSTLPVLKKYVSASEGSTVTMYYNKYGLVEKINNIFENHELKYEFDEHNFPVKVNYPLFDNEFVEIKFDIKFDGKNITAVKFIFDQKMKQKIDESDEAANMVHMNITNIMDNYTNYIGFQNAEFSNNINGNKYTMKNGIDTYKIYNISADSRIEAFKDEKGLLTKLNSANEAVYKYDTMGKMTEMTVNGLVTKIEYTKSTEDGYDVYTNNVSFMPAKYYIKGGYVARYTEGSEKESLVDTWYNKNYQRTSVTNAYDGNSYSHITFEYYE